MTIGLAQGQQEPPYLRETEEITAYAAVSYEDFCK